MNELYEIQTIDPTQYLNEEEGYHWEKHWLRDSQITKIHENLLKLHDNKRTRIKLDMDSN